MAAASYNFCIKGVHFSFNFGCYSTQVNIVVKNRERGVFTSRKKSFKRGETYLSIVHYNRNKNIRLIYCFQLVFSLNLMLEGKR